MTNDRSRQALVAAGIVVALIGAALFYLLPARHAGNAWEATMTLLLLVMAVGIRRFHPGRQLGWGALWIGLCSAHLGGLLAGRPWLLGLEPGEPSVVDVLRLANYPLGAVGVLVLMFRSGWQIGWRALLDTALVAGAGCMVIWLTVVDPMLAVSSDDGLAFAVELAYPAMDVLLLSVLVILLLHLDVKAMPFVLVALGLAGNLVADIVVGAQTVAGTYAPGGVVDSGWLLCFAALAIAPSWPTTGVARIVGDDGRLGTARLLLLAASALVVPLLIVVRATDDSRLEVVLAAGGLVLILLAIGRMAVFNRDLRHSRERITADAVTLRSLNRDLEAARTDQRRLLDRVHRLVEQERVQLAAEIHDRPLQSLAGVGYQLERLRMSAARGDLEKTNVLADEMADELAVQIAELRDLMTDIRPPVLDQHGLAGALRDSSGKVMAANADLDVRVEGSCPRLDGDVETVLYRVAQEAVQNIVRHASASQVVIRVHGDEERAVLRIADDGTGFETARLPELLRAGHFGIAGMRERVELLGGNMRIDSTTRGTVIEFVVPSAHGGDRKIREMESVT